MAECPKELTSRAEIGTHRRRRKDRSYNINQRHYSATGDIVTLGLSRMDQKDMASPSGLNMERARAQPNRSGARIILSAEKAKFHRARDKAKRRPLSKWQVIGLSESTNHLARRKARWFWNIVGRPLKEGPELSKRAMVQKRAKSPIRWILKTHARAV